jgi:hypothetical protein
MLFGFWWIISLNSIKKLSNKQFEIIWKFPGVEISLNRITELSDENVNSLKKFRWEVINLLWVETIHLASFKKLEKLNKFKFNQKLINKFNNI